MLRSSQLWAEKITTDFPDSLGLTQIDLATRLGRAFGSATSPWDGKGIEKFLFCSLCFGGIVTMASVSDKVTKKRDFKFSLFFGESDEYCWFGGAV